LFAFLLSLDQPHSRISGTVRRRLPRQAGLSIHKTRSIISTTSQ